MHIAVIGAGVVGTTTAQALSQRGHTVTVIERLGQAGLETSRANAGQRSYGAVYPWASPAMMQKALPWLMQRDGPLKMRQPPSLTTLRFLFATWRYATTPGLFDENKKAMLRLGVYSRECFEALEDTFELEFDGNRAGLIELASNEDSLTDLQAKAALLDEMGIGYQLLDAEQTYALEPGMARSGALKGALRLTEDGTGDCHRFTQSIAKVCEAEGVRFLYGTEVTGVVRERGRLCALNLNDKAGATPEPLAADAFVLCAGTASNELAGHFGIRVPSYPVKGYSLTAPLTDPERAPRSTVIDDQYKVVATRLGNRMRVTGFVELAGYNRQIPERRLETLRKSIHLRFPGAADLKAAEPWTGFRPMTPDGPPIIGVGGEPNLFINTGHGTFGWTLSAASAQLTAQLINGEKTALPLEAFRPQRFG
ncbi:D-amino acid dehydrogenase [Marinobacter sp. chi1]|uniref:D-amino acid dehydrogenase n=1 Tax=Marinobacter suaedae TaxID=3057675 RepID=A0ABT8VVW1_9GAMM|nr:D-amino acid dehydrogenase [Marinobacter sp. chi1]MDO3720116.1 D-amino acid dehydrogenase [Marinobacter sp. chi1]